MSIYQPTADELRVVFEDGAWTIYDKHGPWDGPHVTEGDAWAVIHRRAQWERKHRKGFSDYHRYYGYGW